MTVDLSGGLEDEREYIFATQPDDPEMRESVNAWIWDDSGTFGLPRIGVEAVADQWDTHELQVNMAFADGRVYNIFGSGPVHEPLGSDGRPRILGAGPLSLELIEPYGHLRMRVDGEALVTSTAAQMEGWAPWNATGDRIPVKAEIDIYPAVPPWVNGAMLPEAKHVLDTQDEGFLMGHPWRFEQLCRASGTITVGDETRRLEGGANRIRRQSIRRLGTFRGHAWQAVRFPSGRAFGYIAYPERDDGLPTYNEGYTFTGDGPLMPARAVQVPWLTSLAANGQDVSVALESGGEVATIRGETLASTFMVMPPEAGGLQLQQALVQYTWDGESAVGMIERSSALKA